MISEKQKIAVMLRAKGFTDEEIAELEGVCLNAIKDRLIKAREAIGAINTCQLVAIAVHRGIIEGGFD